MRAAFVPAALALASVMLFIPITAHAEGGSPAEPAATAATVPTAGEVIDAHRQIEATLAQMRATSLRVRDDLRVTRKRGSNPQITCVDEALSRSDVAFRRGRDLGNEILGAYGRDDLEGARGARRRLAELHEAQRQVAMTAASCAARATPLVPVANAATSVTLQIDPNIAPVR